MKTDRERMAALRERRRKGGLRQVTVWVPEGDVEYFRRWAARRRERAERQAEKPAPPVVQERPPKRKRKAADKAAPLTEPLLPNGSWAGAGKKPQDAGKPVVGGTPGREVPSAADEARTRLEEHLRIWVQERPVGVSKTKARKTLTDTARGVADEQGWGLKITEIESLVSAAIRQWW